MKKLCFVLLSILPGVIFGAESNRPAAWAAPMALEGVPNLHKVSDTLYRSAQPTAVGMQNLEKLGIKTVINVRTFHSDTDELKGTGLESVRLHMKTWHMEDEDAVRFLQIATDPARTPVLVHCEHGADRTGGLSAAYRMVVQGWSKEAAIQEMTGGGFGFHSLWSNIPAWIRNLDVDAVKKELAP
jgi:protein tyrosine/serine phosphatase